MLLLNDAVLKFLDQNQKTNENDWIQEFAESFPLICVLHGALLVMSYNLKMNKGIPLKSLLNRPSGFLYFFYQYIY